MRSAGPGVLVSRRPAAPLAPLATAEVRVLWWSLAEHRAQEHLLTPAELMRAARLPPGLVRERFLSRRTTLRRVLGALTGRAPGAVRLGRAVCPRCGPSDHGRPLVLPASEPLEISAGSSGDIAVLGLAMHLRLGVDVECPREVSAFDLGAVALTARERAHLDEARHEERSALLLRCWTRKEALLKAVGLGLGETPANIDTEIGSAAPLRVELPDGAGTSRWTVHDLSAPGAAIAVAHAGAREAVTCHHLSATALEGSGGQ